MTVGLEGGRRNPPSPPRSLSLEKKTDKKESDGKGSRRRRHGREGAALYQLTIAWRRIVNGNNTPSWPYSISQSNGKVALARANLKDVRTEGNPPSPDESLAMFQGSNVVSRFALIQETCCHLLRRHERVSHGNVR